MQDARYNVIVPTTYGAMIINRDSHMASPGDRFGISQDLKRHHLDLRPARCNRAMLRTHFRLP